MTASENRIILRNCLCLRRRMVGWRLCSANAWKSGNLGLSVVLLSSGLCFFENINLAFLQKVGWWVSQIFSINMGIAAGNVWRLPSVMSEVSSSRSFPGSFQIWIQSLIIFNSLKYLHVALYVICWFWNAIKLFAWESFSCLQLKLKSSDGRDGYLCTFLFPLKFLLNEGYSSHKGQWREWKVLDSSFSFMFTTYIISLIFIFLICKMRIIIKITTTTKTSVGKADHHINK